MDRYLITNSSDIFVKRVYARERDYRYHHTSSYYHSSRPTSSRYTSSHYSAHRCSDRRDRHREDIQDKHCRHHSRDYKETSSSRSLHGTSRRSVSPVVSKPVPVIEAPEPVTFPELWGTYVTEDDERQMDMWRREAEEMLASTPASTRGQAVLDGCKSGSRKRPCEDYTSVYLPPSKVYINKNHVNFRHLY